MPKSKHRKNQKQKSKARTERLKIQKRSMEKKIQEQFMKYMEDMKNREMEIEEVGDISTFTGQTT
tara:strand:+ start:330 stop:524 length:195 start_codon:yes stop_codon:yes gene_type:complete